MRKRTFVDYKSIIKAKYFISRHFQITDFLFFVLYCNFVHIPLYIAYFLFTILQFCIYNTILFTIYILSITIFYLQFTILFTITNDYSDSDISTPESAFNHFSMKFLLKKGPI